MTINSFARASSNGCFHAVLAAAVRTRFSLQQSRQWISGDLVRAGRSLFLSILLCLAPTALACTFNAPAEHRVILVRRSADAVVIGVVESARYGRSGPDWKPWTGTVRVERVVRGQVQKRHYPINRSGSSSACDDGVPAPARGEKWVIYLGMDRGNETVLLSYPVNIARSVDPDLQARSSR